MKIGSGFWLLDITDWWCQQEVTGSKCADLSNVAHEGLSLIPHRVGAEASISVVQDTIGCRQSKTTGETLREKVIVRQFAQTNIGISAGDDPALDMRNTENNLEMKREADEWKLHRIAKVHDSLDMWQGSQNLRATQNESCTQNELMTAVG